MEINKQLVQEYGRTFNQGDVLCGEGETGTDMFFICSGKVQITKKVLGQDKILAVLKEGDFFGEMALLENKPRSATAIVIEKAEIVIIDRAAFETKIAKDAYIILHMLKKLSSRLREVDDEITVLLMKENIRKVVDTLAQFMVTGSNVTKDGIKIKFDTDVVEELSIAAAVEKECILPLLDKLSKAEIIAFEGDTLVVKSFNLLNRFRKYLKLKDELEGIIT